MCSLTLHKDIDAQIAGLGNVERGMRERAWFAKVDRPGVLDGPDTYLQSGFAKDLRQVGVRYERIGRHRIYFLGDHTDCNYSAFFLKSYKQGDNTRTDDNDPNFHSRVRTALKTALREELPRVLPNPDEPEIELEVPDWQNEPWHIENQRYESESE